MNIVDVSTGTVRSYAATYPEFPGARYVVMDYAKEGIYLGLGYEGPISGLWLMDPNTGAIREVGPTYFPDVMAIAGSALWHGSVNPADPNPVGGLGVSSDSIDRFDLVSGSRTPWLYLPESAPRVVAVDLTGHPISLVAHGFSDKAELLLVTAPGIAQQIFHGTQRELEGLGSPIADSHGVWFGSSTGIYLYSPAVGMRKVSNQAGYPGNGCT